MRSYKIKINNSLKELNRGWSGEASNAFTNITSVDWEKTIEDNIEKLTFFRNSLQKVKTAYDNIQNEAKKLKNKV